MRVSKKTSGQKTRLGLYRKITQTQFLVMAYELSKNKRPRGVILSAFLKRLFLSALEKSALEKRLRRKASQRKSTLGKQYFKTTTIQRSQQQSQKNTRKVSVKNHAPLGMLQCWSKVTHYSTLQARKPGMFDENSQMCILLINC